MKLRMKSIWMAGLAAATLSATSAEAGWQLIEDDIAHDGVAEVHSVDEAAVLIVYCAKAALETPTFALRVPLAGAFGVGDYTTIQLIGPPQEVRGEDGQTHSVADVTPIEGEVKLSGENLVFVADEATVGFYHPKLRVLTEFGLEIGGARYDFDGHQPQLTEQALDRCLHW